MLKDAFNTGFRAYYVSGRQFPYLDDKMNDSWSAGVKAAHYSWFKPFWYVWYLTGWFMFSMED